MWSGPLHDPAFISQVLEHVESSQEKYGTFSRMKGMLTVAKEVHSIATHVGVIVTNIGQ